ncbi:unnamed protein product, partial [Prorocentrum cordatum]
VLDQMIYGGWRSHAASVPARLPLPWAAACLVARPAAVGIWRMCAAVPTVLVDNVDQFPSSTGAEESLVFPFSYREWAVAIEAACQAVGLTCEMTPVLYMLRQGVAPHDAATRARGFRDIQDRGKWMTD